MTVVNPKSISGINSITMASGSDNLLTIHSNNTTERVRVDSSGNVTATSFSGDGSSLTGVASTENIRTNTNATFLQNVNVSGSTTTGSLVSSGAISGTTGTFTGNVDIAANIRHIDDSDTFISFPANNEIEMYVASQQAIKFTTTSIETGDNKRIDIIDAAGDRSGEIKNSDSTANSLMISADPDNSGSNSVIQFSLDGSEKARLDTSGRLLIGNTDGATYADSSNDDLIIGSTANGKNDGITILSGTSQNGTLAFADSGGAYQGLVGYVHNGDYLRLHAGNTLKARIDTDGLKFNSDTASANALDDYEQGTWTPSTTEGMNSISGANYVKVGAKVSVQAYITLPTSSDGNNIRIDSFPFTSKSNNHYAIGAAYAQWSGSDHIFIQMSPGATHAYIYKNIGNSVTYANGSGGYFLFSMTYFTA